MMLKILIRTLYSRNDFLTSTTPVTRVSPFLCKNYAQPRILLNMNEALIEHNEGSNDFSISFRYVNPELNIDRQFNFARRANEPIQNFLSKIDARIAKLLVKKQRKKKEVIPEIVDNVENNKIRILKNNLKLDGELPCKVLLDNPSEMRLIVLDEEYLFKINVPTVTRIALSASMLVGFPTYPAKFEAMFTDREKSIFKWYKANDARKGASKWDHVGDGYIYLPDISDIGCRLKISCIPRNDMDTGPVTEVESEGPVSAGPGPCPFETRHAFTTNKLSGKRVVSYNILADTYTTSDYSKDVLFPYCPEYALNMDYRKQLILKELIGYNADIICLQEVDSKIYQHDLLTTLSTLNYDGVYNTKNELREGLAMFFNRERFEKLSFKNSVISQSTDLEEFQSVWTQIVNEKMRLRFTNRSTTVQATTIRSTENPSEILIVGNIHLYFHPDADHVRLLQAYYAAIYLQKIANETKEKYPDCNISIIFCGDFNSVPECGIYQLLTQNFVPETCVDWKSNAEEAVEHVCLKQDIPLSSACGTPEYTNYTPGFSGCLDYIFYQNNNLEVEQVIPMPSKEEICLHSGLPSVVFPSDHISLCADLRWSK